MRRLLILLAFFLAMSMVPASASVGCSVTRKATMSWSSGVRPTASFPARLFRAADRATERILHLLPPAFQPAPDDLENDMPVNKMANISLLCGLVGYLGFWVILPAALVTGIIALNQIRDSGERGKGRAIAGIVMGGAPIAIAVIAFAWINGQ